MTSAAQAVPLSLPGSLIRRLDHMAEAFLRPSDGPGFDFSQPPGEPALVPASSVSWRIYKNPVTLFIGGVTAVILELAEPGVRSGVWEHSSFRAAPVRRLQRTGLAAMITVYGARSRAQAMIAGVGRMHARVRGETPDGRAYRADDPELLTWVQATASFGFAEAYHRYVRPMSRAELDRLYDESIPVARLYGAVDAPRSEEERETLFDAMRPRLEPSPIVFEFLALMRGAAVLPAPLRPLQGLLLRAAVEATPGWLRERLGLGPKFGLRPWQAALVRRICATADRVPLHSSAPVQSCLRLGLPADYLFRQPPAQGENPVRRTASDP
ncbi:oxygenase MpaB family protein [Roseomonas marmotae]|uniref:DUF2236 domain-containing protein n=1 Tax=Roseomonas marmotae TaxID=2768161 RepID=A0ABS3KG54_9PROT|nr:oxygenase MpaB family protein [Roseomonas marmotae]MBO1076456.1 DUF2236 domain-containing protein [Roseomonas marmotae]QTI77942.1 DUF2236 domain-containing protein [Roseomonas marmotae]